MPLATTPSHPNQLTVVTTEDLLKIEHFWSLGRRAAHLTDHIPNPHVEQLAERVLYAVRAGMSDKPLEIKRTPSPRKLQSIGSIVLMVLQHEDFLKGIDMDLLKQRWESECGVPGHPAATPADFQEGRDPE